MRWWHRLLRRGELEEQLDKELRFHLDQHAADLIAGGRDPREARRQARLALGAPELVKEGCRDARGTRWLEDLAQDTRYALRTLRQRPGFAAVAVLTLALGTGATTVMFAVINSVLLKPLPYPEPDKLLTVAEQTERPTQYGNIWAFAYPNYLDCERESRGVTMAAWRATGGTISQPGEAQYVYSRQVSSGLFTILGVSFEQGRGFLEEEDRLGASPVAVISHSLWLSRFAGNPQAVGMSVVFEGKSYTVIGVTPPGFQLSGEADVFTLLGQDTDPALRSRRAHPRINVWARLRPGVTPVESQTELGLIGRHLAEQYPDTNDGRSFVAQPLRANVGEVRSTLWLLMGAVSLVLLIACVNVASLLLARAVSRQRELAIRVALGAGRGRLLRQCLTESAVLGLAGGMLGVLLASLGIRPFVQFWPGSLPRAEEVQLDWRVLLFALALSLLSGLLFGLAPALRAPVRGLEQALRAGARTVAGSSRRLHAAFVVSEITLAVVLLVSAGMLGRTLLRLSSLDPGVDVHNVLVARMSLSPGTRTDAAQMRVAWKEVLDRARSVPGVQAAATVDTVPMRDGNNQLAYWTGPDSPPLNQMPLALATSVSPDYLKVMGIPLRQGRFFDDQDRIGNQLVVVIDDVLAQHAFPGEQAVGKRLWIRAIPWDTAGPALIVGVVGHVRHWGPAGDDSAQVRDQFYYPFAQVPDPLMRRWSELMSVAVRTSLPPLTMVQSLQQTVRGAAGDQVLYQIRTVEQLASASLALQRFLLLLFGIFAGVALLLACIGIYGVLAYLTSQRVPEIGVRMALGASAGDVVRLVLGQSLGMIFIGIGLGLAAALAAGRLMVNLVPGARPTEPLTFAVMICVLAGAALLASFIPARRASRIDPTSALRQE